MLRSKLGIPSLAVVASALLALSGCESSESSEPERIAAAKAVAASQGRDAAEVEWKSVLAKFPNSGEARFQLGMTLLDRGDADAARIELQRARDAKYDERKVLPALARAMIESGEPKRVIESYAETRLDDPLAMADLLTTLSKAYVALGSKELAQQSIDRALQLAPDADDTVIQAALMQAVDGRWDAGLKRIDVFLASKPASAKAWIARARIVIGAPARGQKELDEAVTAYRKGISLDEKAPSPRAELITLLLVSRRIDDAKAELDGLRKVAPRLLLTGLLEAQVAAAQQDWPRARSAYQAFLSAAPNHVQALLGAAEVEYALNSYAQAAVYSGKALSLAPDSLRARMALAYAQLRQGQTERCLSTLASLVATKDPLPQALSLAAQAHLMRNDQAAADAMLKRLRSVKTDDPALKIAVAAAQLETGANVPAAIEVLRAASAADASTLADTLLIGHFARAKRYAEAGQAIDVLLKKQPNDPLGYHLRGAVAQMAGDAAKAREGFADALKHEKNYLPAILALAGLDVAEKKFDDARRRLDAYLASDPNNATVLLAKAEVLKAGGMPRKDRLDALQAAVKADSSNVLAQIALIDFFAEAGEHQAAADAAQQALSASPDNVDLVIRQGRAQLAMGNRDQALASFAKALSVSPNAVDAHLGRAEASLAARQFADAERSVASALDRAPDNPDVLRAQARLRIAQQQYDAAIASAKAIQRLRPDSAIGFEIQGDIHLFQGRYEAAAQVLKTVLSKADPGKSALKFHHALLKSGQHDAAERFATEWTRDHPQDHEFVFYLGDSAQQRGNAREAEARYLQALAVQDDYLPALNNLALLLSARRDPRARGLIERALALAPTDPQLIDSMAQVLRDEGRLNEAIETQHRAVRLAPKNGQLRLHLAHLMIDANDPTAARAEIRAVSDPQGGFSAAEREQARALLRSLSR